MLLVLMLDNVLFSPSMCLDDIQLGLGSCEASFWERAAHPVNHIFSLCNVCNFGYFPIWFRGRDFGSDYTSFLVISYLFTFEPRCEKTGLRGF